MSLPLTDKELEELEEGLRIRAGIWISHQLLPDNWHPTPTELFDYCSIQIRWLSFNERHLREALHDLIHRGVVEMDENRKLWWMT